MQYKFKAYGHPNILGTHKTTLEFTKDKDITLNGNCIIGVKADFELSELKKFIGKISNKKITITIETMDKKIKEIIAAELNPSFECENEIVIRKTDFVSDRTIGISADKAAFELSRKLISYLKQKESKIAVILESQ
jgi:uncharacterized protein